jgi:hypothetical protein
MGTAGAVLGAPYFQRVTPIKCEGFRITESFYFKKVNTVGELLALQRTEVRSGDGLFLELLTVC